MKRKIFFFRKEMMYGGQELLMCRMAKWFNANKFEAYIVSVSAGDTILDYARNHNVSIEFVKNWRASDWKRIIHRDNRPCLCVFFDLLEMAYFDCEEQDHRTRSLMYITHPNVLLYGLKRNSKLFKTIEDTYLRSILTDYLNRGKIIFNDNDSLDKTFQYYGLKNREQFQNGIIGVPLEIDEDNAYEYKLRLKRFESKDINILAVARANFPFKGYLVGLVKAFSQADFGDINVYLTIVSFGDDIDVLKRVVKQFNRSGRIKLVGAIGNVALQQYYEEATIYVGMGTTILEASNHMLPAVVVEMDTFEFRSSGLFVDMPDEFVAYGQMFNGMEYIRRIIEMSPNQYADVCIRSKEELRKHYDINKNLRSLYTHKANNHLGTVTRTKIKLYRELSRRYRIFVKHPI